jgi:hypothetical protein
MARRQHLTLTLVAVMVFLALTYHISTRSGDASPMGAYDNKYSPIDSGSSSGSSSGGTSGSSSGSNPVPGVSESILSGGSIAPKLENATAKYASPHPLLARRRPPANPLSPTEPN